MPAGSDQEFLFADYVLVLGRRELHRGARPIAVEPQVFDLLAYLVQNRDHVVSRNELIAGVWDGRIVSDSTVTSRINAARKAIGDNGEKQALIRTIPRKGIRFVGDVYERSSGRVPVPNGATAGKEATTSGDVPIEPPPTELPAARPSKTRKPGWILAGGLAAAMAIFLVFQVALPTGPLLVKTGSETGEPAGKISVAVLPFTNLSSDADQEYFSDGITEEITSALARIPNLRVVARTSAFEFKGQNRNIQMIAQMLHATHLIEGSVRKAGDQVRVTAQLIQADSGHQVWTDSYDRQLVNIFAIQKDIAEAVARALRIPLGLEGKTLVSNRLIEPESYQQFLRAKALVRQRRGPGQGSADEGLTEAIKLLEWLVARNPDFAPAWAQLALAYQRIPFYAQPLEFATAEVKRRAADESLPKAQAAAERAIQLDADLADGYSSLGLTMATRSRLLEAERLLSKALALDRFSPEALQIYANLLGAVGRTGEALAMKQQLLNMEPFVDAYNGGVRDLLWTSGQTDALIAQLKATSSPVNLSYSAQLYSMQGRYRDAADALRAIPPGTYPEGMLEDAVRLLSSAPVAPGSPLDLPRLGDRLDFVYIFIGAPERVLERFENDVAAGFSSPNLVTRLWSPIYAPVRKTERFKAFARNAGLVEYWRAKGWPAYCRPAGVDDFVCD